MADFEITSLFIEKKTLIFFLSMSLFFTIFSIVNERKNVLSQRIFVKGTLLLYKNITCLNGIFFRESTLLSLSLNFLGSINSYNIKKLWKQLHKQLYKENPPNKSNVKDSRYIYLTCKSKWLIIYFLPSFLIHIFKQCS